LVLVLSNDDVSRLLSMKACVSALEEGFAELGRGRAVASNRRDSHSPSTPKGTYYRFNTMEGIIYKLGVCAQRIDSERITWKKIDGIVRQVELPSADGGFVGLVYLYSIRDCRLLAVLNDSEIQRRRVAGVCAVAAKYLSRKDSKVLGLYGSGWQAEAQVLAMKQVRDIETVKVYSPNPAHRRQFARRMSLATGMDVVAVDTPMEAAHGADIVSAATNARQAVFESSWLTPGLHLCGIGGGDYDEKTWEASDLIYMCAKGFHEKYLMENPRMRPDLKYDHMTSSGGVEGALYKKFSKRTNYLPQLLVGKSPKRSSSEQVTLFQKVGTSQGIEFASTAKAVYDQALKQGAGREIPNKWFVQSTPQ